MNRSEFLKTIGIAGLGAMLPGGSAKSAREGAGNAARLYEGVDCVLIPQETAGPYPLDLSDNAAMFRQDITEGKSGLPLNLILTVVDVNAGCAPVADARVDIWHCDKDGVYSGYSQPGANTVGETFMRGIQMTDSNGRVEFHTIYPGWYTGRITHIHVQVFLNALLSATSQAAFPEDLTKAVYATPLYVSHGQNTSVASNAADNVFSSPASALQYEILNVTANAETGGYDAVLTIGVNVPAAGIIDLEPETGGQFTLEQNSPNPFKSGTSIGFTLVQSSQVELTIFDVAGRRLTTLLDQSMSAGEYRTKWDGTIDGAPTQAGSYLFQLTVENSAGRFVKSKVMTLLE